MNHARDFEISNAQLWELESQLTVDDDERKLRASEPISSSPETTSEPQVLRATEALGNLKTTKTGNQMQQRAPGNRNHRPPIQQTRGPPNRTLSTTRRQPPGTVTTAPKPRQKWAESVGLITTRKAAQTSINTWSEQQKERYIKGRPENVEISVQGHYLWPDKVQTPYELFGHTLENLNPIRIEHKIFIEWEDPFLLAKSPKAPHAETNVVNALQEIQQYYKSAKARNLEGEPIYIVAPPTASGMTSLLRPAKYREGLTMIELAGEKLSAKDKEAWNAYRKSMINDNYAVFQYHLSKHILALAPHKGWMRMRVHFGHHNMPFYPPDFHGGGSFQRFQEILKMPRAQAKAKFDKKLPHPKAAVLMKESVIGWPERFYPRDGQADSLNAVAFRDTLCLFLKNSQGDAVRIEADVDRANTGDDGIYSETRSTYDDFEYQIGTIRYYWDNRRNKHLELVTIDVERKMDWSLELITDKKIHNPDPEWSKLIQGYVNSRTKTRQDSLDLPYADISPGPSRNIKIDTTVLRSTIQYQLIGSGYVVEISIYRTWSGLDVKSEPSIEASVSMFHLDWEWQLNERSEDSGGSRDWDENLTELFGHSSKTETGIQQFIDEVGQIQSDLSQFCRKFFEELKGASTSE